MNIYENRFDIDKFVEICKEKDWIDIITFAQKECDNSSKEIKNVDVYINERRQKYYHFVHELSFYVQSGIKPVGMNDDELKKAKIIIDRLKEKGQWTKDE